MRTILGTEHSVCLQTLALSQNIDERIGLKIFKIFLWRKMPGLFLTHCNCFPLKRKASSEHNVQVMSPKGHWVAFPTTLMHSSFLSIVVNREKPFPCFPRHALPLFLLLPKGSSRSLGSQGSLILVSQVSNASTFLCGECWQNPNGLFTCWQLNMLPKVNRVFFSFLTHMCCPIFRWKMSLNVQRWSENRPVFVYV